MKREKMQRAAFERAEDDVRVALMTAAAAIPEPDNKRGPPSEGPHLVPRKSRTDPTKITWYIRDGRVEVSTRQPEAQRKKAERVLDLYKLQKEARERGIVAPRMVPVAATLNHLLDAARPPGKPPAPRKTSLRTAAAKKKARVWKKYRQLVTRIKSLATFFKDETLKDLTTTRLLEYIEWRTGQRDARYLDDDPDAPNASPSSAREDICFLRKAVNLYAGEHTLAWHPNVEVPAQGPGRTRWLRRPEVARMYWAIRGRIWDNDAGAWKRELVMGPRGRKVWRYAYRDPQTIANRKALRRYLFVGLYTGTRDEALRELCWECSADGGCIDVEGRFIHRRGFGLDPSEGKPRMTSRIAPKVASTMGGWRKSDLAAGISAVVSRPDGEPYASAPVWIWEAVVADAGLDAEVVRHTLRHTAATWLRIGRVDVRAAADLLGMSVQTAVKIYGQWTLEGQEAAADALAWSHGVKAAHSFAIKVPSTIEVVVPRGLPPREHPGQVERRRRERIRDDRGSRKRIEGDAVHLRAAKASS
ncbi:hypothetical protein ACLBWX_20885 [Methylobacterium sp. M6A4_1b]